MEFVSKYNTFHWWKCICKCRLRHVGHFVLGEMSWVLLIVSPQGHQPFRQRFVACTVVNHCLDQCWLTLLSFGSYETSFDENWIKIQNFSFNKMHLKAVCTTMVIFFEPYPWLHRQRNPKHPAPISKTPLWFCHNKLNVGYLVFA